MTILNATDLGRDWVRTKFRASVRVSKPSRSPRCQLGQMRTQFSLRKQFCKGGRPRRLESSVNWVYKSERFLESFGSQKEAKIQLCHSGSKVGEFNGVVDFSRIYRCWHEDGRLTILDSSPNVWWIPAKVKRRWKPFKPSSEAKKVWTQGRLPIGGLQPISRDRDNNAAKYNCWWTNKRS